MTRARTVRTRWLKSGLIGASALVWAVLGGGCQRGPELTPPSVLVSPYQGAGVGDALWAVAPLRNESGTSAVDVLGMTDVLVAKVQETRGLAAVSTNRVIGAMRGLGMSQVRTPRDAAMLARALGVDAVIVGTITAYDPYDPPTVGLTLGVYGASGERGAGESAESARSIAGSTTEGDVEVRMRRDGTRWGGWGERPRAVVSEHFDGRNHEVLMHLKRYAAGRVEAQSALDWRGYLANSQRFVEFAAHETLGRLLDEERLRLARQATNRAQQAVTAETMRR
jgi:hypothetical protein